MPPARLDCRRIRWIAFDAVGTLIHPDPSVASVYHDAAIRRGSRRAQPEISERFRRAFALTEREGALSCSCADGSESFHTCEGREELRWRSIVNSVLDDVASDESCFSELFAHFGRPASWKCFPEVGPTLTALSQAGFRLAVSSNFDSRLNAVMDGIPALGPIELRVVSSEIGHRKPSPRFFKSLLQAAEVSPSEILFVGDDPQNDIQAAEAAGIGALRIDRSTTGRENRALGSLAELVDLLRR